ncbi:DMT family transporter [Oxalobacter vibrioformis]|uniref:DMT family transporter n=1 Tax=Oxalobacter vibrioformis TaxID=933080 RepID=A0A9E9P1U8_9BURK|nr:DMT family transporter [Oxalobacter vibrioformis]NLC24136.1 DMT family transporter [Oxalobacter sp.]WAW09237.1 DMT family transporter [Oxalobacter vibrioformis]
MNSLSRKDILLLIVLTLFWGLNWPVMKFGVTNIPPVTFRVMGMFCSLPVMWFFARRMNESIAVPKAYILPLIRLAIPNILICQTMMILGVKMLSSGRAAILCYTMPVWAVIFSCLLFKEKLSRMAFFGIICAAAGALLLLSGDFSVLSSGSTGTCIALGAAAIWGYGTVQLRRKQIPVPTSSLTFWMIAFSATVMALIALIFEHPSWRMPEPLEWAAILYNAIFVFGVATTIWNKMARTLPPVASGLSIMMVPVVGVFSGAWILSETPHWQDYVAMLLILVSMSTVLLKPGASARK